MVMRWACDDSAMHLRWGHQRRLRLYARMGRGGDAERASLWPGKRFLLPLILLNGSSMPPHREVSANLELLSDSLVARRFNRGPQRRLRLYARMGRGGDAERCSLWPGKRLSIAKPSPTISWTHLIRASSDCECKITTFFWHGNGLVRIACGIGPDCVQVPPWLGKARKKK